MASPLLGPLAPLGSGSRRSSVPTFPSHTAKSPDTVSPSLASHAAMFSPGDLIWVPSASEGYSTAVFISLNIAQETLTAQLHPVAAEHAEAARAAFHDFSSATSSHSAPLDTPSSPVVVHDSQPSDSKKDRSDEDPAPHGENEVRDGLLRPTTTNGTSGSVGDLAAALLAELGEAGDVPLSPLSAAVQAHQEALSVPSSPRDTRPRICVLPPAGNKKEKDGKTSLPSAAGSGPCFASGVDPGAPGTWARGASGGETSVSSSVARSECTVTVPLADCWPYHPSPLPPEQPPEDASALDSLSSPSILELLEHRFIRRQIYTNAAHVLLALNPYTDLKELYSQDVIEVYRHWKNNSAASAAATLLPSTARLLGLVKSPASTKGESSTEFHGSPFPPPHPFAVAEDAHRRLRGEGRNQTIIVSGESGAGKTETSKIIMLYLTQVGVLPEAEKTSEGTKGLEVSLGGSLHSRQERERAVAAMLGEGGKGQTKTQVSSLQQKILSCNPVLEAFCNATTKRNVNSSRVGRLTLLHFDTVGLLRGASIKTYLLESARVSAHSPWERNYHIFYQILRGCTEEDLSRRELTRNCGSYGLLRPTQPRHPQQQQRGGRMQSRNTAEDFRMRSCGNSSADRSDPRPPSKDELERDERHFRALLEALRTTGFSGRQIAELLDILAGLLHLSNVTFKEAPPLKAGDTHCLLLADLEDEDKAAKGLAPSSSGPRTSRASSTLDDERRTSGLSARWTDEDGSQAKDWGEGKRSEGHMSHEDIVAASDLNTNTSEAARALRVASRLLQIPGDELLDALRWEVLKTKHDVVKKERKEKQAFAARDALIKHIYKKLVAYILGELNRNVKRCTDTSTKEDDADGHTQDSDDEDEEIGEGSLDFAGNFIGILDIYGFECVDGFNGFDQLCINYANERQQELFIQKVLHEELRLYCREGIMAAPSSSLRSGPTSFSPPPHHPPRQSSACTFSSSSPPYVFASSHSRNISFQSPKQTPDGVAPSSYLMPSSGEVLSQSRQQSNFLLTPSYFSSPVPCPLPLPGRNQHSSPSIPDSSLLLYYLHEGLFRRLDDNSRLKAQGQSRTDSNFWKDLFLFCRQQDQYRVPPSSSSDKRESSILERDEGDQSVISPVLFRVKGGITAALNIHGGGSGAGAGSSTGLACLAWKKKQQLQEAEEGLVSAGRVSPQLTDGNAAANKLAEGVFVIRHFAGLVEYSVEGWLDRNNDKAEASIETLLTTASSMKTLNRLGRIDGCSESQQNGDPPSSPHLSSTTGCTTAKERLAALVYGRAAGGAGGNFLTGTGGNSNSNRAGGHFVSLSRNFINDLKQLMSQLQSSEMHLHFIRCFVPNAQMLPLTFNRLLLLKQLQQSGSVALVHILHQGFPHRLPLRATAASFKARLAVCLNTVLDQIAARGGGDSNVRRKLKTLQNLHSLPDGRLVSSALSLLPTCPPGTHCCGTSLICLKAQSFPAASQLLRHPETFFSTSEPFVDLVTELTRRRWRIAGFIIGGRVHRVLQWLLRRVQLLRRLKEEGARLAVRIILLKRVILRPLRQKIETRAKIKQGLKALGKFSLARGFRTWKKNWKRWADAEAALASLEARRRLKESGAKSGVVPNWKRQKSKKKEDGDTGEGGELERTLSWRQLALAELKKKQQEEKDKKKKHTEKQEEEERKRQQRLATTTFQALRNAKEGWKTAWKAELFSLGMMGKEACEERGTEGEREGISMRTKRILCEKMVLFSGGNIYNISLFFKKRKCYSPSRSTRPSPSPLEEGHMRTSSASPFKRRFDRGDFYSREDERSDTRGRLKELWRRNEEGERTTGDSHDSLELVDVKTSLCFFQELLVSSFTDSSFTSSFLIDSTPNTKRGSLDHTRTVRPPCLSCLGQHQQHPNLFVACDVSARIFLIPFSLPSPSDSSDTERASSPSPSPHSVQGGGSGDRDAIRQKQGFRLPHSSCDVIRDDDLSIASAPIPLRGRKEGMRSGSSSMGDSSRGGSPSRGHASSGRCSPCAPPPRKSLRDERDSSFEDLGGRRIERNNDPSSLVLLMKAASPSSGGHDSSRNESSLTYTRQTPNRGGLHTPPALHRDVRRGDREISQDLPPSRAMRREGRKHFDVLSSAVHNASVQSDRPSYSAFSSFEDPGLRQENGPPPPPALSRIGSQCSSVGENVSPSNSSTSAACSFRRSSSLGGSSTSSYLLPTDPSRGQPSTWLPSLVPTSRWYYGGEGGDRASRIVYADAKPPSVRDGVHSGEEGDADLVSRDGKKSLLQIKSSNPYICRFFREIPPPLPRHFFYPRGSHSSLPLSSSTEALTRREDDSERVPFSTIDLIAGEKKPEVYTGPKTFISSSFPSSALLLPGWACLPASIAPVAWTPDALLRRAQREREKWQKRHTPREERETGISPKRPHEAAVRTLRVRFASPHSTSYVLILCHIAVNPDERKRNNRAGGGGAGCVGGILGLVLLNLVTQKPEAWVEVTPAEPDVVTCARKHKEVLQELLYTPGVWSNRSSIEEEDVLGGMMLAGGDGGNPTEGGREDEKNTKHMSSLSLRGPVSHHSRSKIISATLLEPLGEGGNLWVVAGAAVLAVVQVTLPNLCPFYEESECQEEGEGMKKTWDREEEYLGKHEVRERGASLEVVWNAATVQSISSDYPSLDVASTWFTGCMYTASPLSSLQDVSSSHPLFYFSSVLSSSMEEDSSGFLSSLRKDIQRLLLLSTARGELVLLRWLQSKRILQLLETKVTRKRPSTREGLLGSSAVQRFLRVEYTSQTNDGIVDQEEDDDSPSPHADPRNKKTKSLRSRATMGGAVLKVTAPHPHLEKKMNDFSPAYNGGDPYGRSFGRESAKPRELVETRWCEDIASVRMRSGTILRPAPLVRLPGTSPPPRGTKLKKDRRGDDEEDFHKIEYGKDSCERGGARHQHQRKSADSSWMSRGDAETQTESGREDEFVSTDEDVTDEEQEDAARRHRLIAFAPLSGVKDTIAVVRVTDTSQPQVSLLDVREKRPASWTELEL